MSLTQAERKFPGLAVGAADAEMAQLDNRGTITPIMRAPDGEQIIHSRLFLTPKYDIDGALKKMKGRLVASGDEIDQSEYTSASETASPTLRFEGLMMILSIASHEKDLVMGDIDYPGAFLNATLKKKRYMFLSRESAEALCKVRLEYRKFLRKDGRMLVVIHNALYGLPESGKRWYDCLTEFLLEVGYTQSQMDKCIFYKTKGKDKIIFGLHVDDKIYISTSQYLVDEFLTSLEKRFGTVTHNTGDVLSFLGLRIIRNRQTGEITVDQPAYLNDLVDDIPDYRLPTSPVSREIIQRSEFGESVDSKVYTSRVMKLMYLATKTRPDVLFGVSTLASRTSDPKQIDMHQLDRIYKYLRGTKDFQLKIKCDNMVLSASVDASFGVHRDGKSHSGMVLLVSGCPIFSRSTKQKSVATSSMHAEILALYEAIPYILWARELMRELGYEQKAATKIEQDNEAALTVYDQGWSKSNKTRHLGIKYAFIGEQIEQDVIEPVYTKTNDVKADILTKPIHGKKFYDY